MTAAIRAELLKIRTTRLWWGLLLAALGLVVLGVVFSALGAGEANAGPGLDTAEGVRNVVAAAGGGYVFTLVLGVMGSAGEYRHQTVTSTLLAVPRRTRVVLAKLAAYAVAGFGFALVCVGVGVAIALPLLSARDADMDLLDLRAQVPALLAGTTLYALIGVAVGSLVRNLVAAVIGALVWVWVIEALLVLLLPEVGRWLPGGAANAMLQAATIRGELLQPWAGALLFFAYTVVLTVAAAFTTVRRDVT
ncbi:MAG: ABC transporter permease [Actinomycetota bacterium]|nr:ABC transporter permease [Actinomycetota bacterium]